MFERVLGAACSIGPASQCHVVSRSSLILDIAARRGARPVAELGFDHNAALAQAAHVVGCDRPVMVLSGDLPFVTADDLRDMYEALAPDSVVIACDRSGLGSNALLQPRPGAIPFLFGAGSHAAHRNAACAAGLRPVTFQSEGLAVDIDLPADLALFDSERAYIVGTSDQGRAQLAFCR
jgi:2-phospho-L-lactate/phosphoenolpyruvate guanylyltransferase